MHLSKFCKGEEGGGGGLMLVTLQEKVSSYVCRNKKSVAVEEIKEVELRSRPAQFIYDRIG